MNRVCAVIRVFLLLSLCIPNSYAQQNDVYSWNGISVKKSFSNFTLYLQEEIRLKINYSCFNEGFVQGGIQYKFSDWLSITQFYRYIIENETEYYKYVNMYFTDAKFTYELYRTKISFRSRYQITRDRNEEYNIYEHISRNKLEISRDLHQSPVTPSLGYELFLAVYPEIKPYIYKNRFIGGADVRITNAIELGLSYYFDLARDPNKAVNNHIFVTHFSYEF